MRYEVWGTCTGNRIATEPTEEAALDLVRELLEMGWEADELAMAFKADTEDERAVLPVALVGEALKARACHYA
ncbi:MAG: hypothetical protein IT307_14275 [Chloroflexi bacterium]|nr:hypothetical protein [Chloroflexota bacterium]